MRIGVALFLLGFWLPALADDGMADIKSRCYTKWGTDYEMIRYCMDQQLTALRSVSQTVDSLMQSEEGKNIANRCFGKWQDVHGPDYEMIEYCIKQQREAAQALKRY